MIAESVLILTALLLNGNLLCCFGAPVKLPRAKGGDGSNSVGKCPKDQVPMSNGQGCIHCSACNELDMVKKNKIGCHQCEEGDDSNAITKCPNGQVPMMNGEGCIHCVVCDNLDPMKRKKLGCDRCGTRSTEHTKPDDQPTTVPNSSTSDRHSNRVTNPSIESPDEVNFQPDSDKSDREIVPTCILVVEVAIVIVLLGFLCVIKKKWFGYRSHHRPDHTSWCVNSSVADDDEQHAGTDSPQNNTNGDEINMKFQSGDDNRHSDKRGKNVTDLETSFDQNDVDDKKDWPILDNDGNFGVGSRTNGGDEHGKYDDSNYDRLCKAGHKPSQDTRCPGTPPDKYRLPRENHCARVHEQKLTVV